MNKNDARDGFIFGILAGLMLAVCVGAPLFGLWVTHLTRQEAVQHDAGRWAVDDKTGKTRWEWTGAKP